MEDDLQELISLFKKEKPIIILGGVAGSGKTTAGNFLLHALDLDHKLGTGWIREIMASTTSKEIMPELFGYSFRSVHKEISPFEHFTKLSKIILPAIEFCINRARREGQSLLIEGPMIVPGILKPEMYDMFMLLKKPENANEHLVALTTGTHTKRKINLEDILPNEQIEKELLARCKAYSIPIISFLERKEREKKMLEEIKLKFLGRR